MKHDIDYLKMGDNPGLVRGADEDMKRKLDEATDWKNPFKFVSNVNN